MNRCHFCEKYGTFYLGGGVYVCFEHWCRTLFRATETPEMKEPR